MDPEVTTELVAAAAKAAVKVAAAWAKVAVAVKVVAVVAASVAMAGLVVGVEVVAAASREALPVADALAVLREDAAAVDTIRHGLVRTSPQYGRSAPAAQC